MLFPDSSGEDKKALQETSFEFRLSYPKVLGKRSRGYGC
jgi:hypothetical protein